MLPAQFEQLAQAISICFLQHYHHSTDVTLLARKLQGKRILVIEDDDDHWQLIRQGINRHLPGVNVVNTIDAAGTVNFLQDTLGLPMPELIILDLYLPTRELGLELLAWIRDFLARQKQPPVIIVFSSSGHQQDIGQSYAVGANAYLVKTENLTRSVSYFKHLCYFWWDTVTLPYKGF